MKKLTSLVILMIISSSVLFAQIAQKHRGVKSDIQSQTITKSIALPLCPLASNTEIDFEDEVEFTFDFNPWTTADVDGHDTYGFAGFDFPNEYAAMAYIVFNPSTTTPPMIDDPEIQPHSGEQFGACFASVGSNGNDDWFISPQLELGVNASFTFWAKSYTDQYGLEKFNIAVSTTTNNPADFTVISGETPVEAPVVWTEYNYDLSNYVGEDVYIAIQCVSFNAFVFMIDDLVVTLANAPHYDFIGGSTIDPYWTIFLAEATLNGNDLESVDEIAIFDNDIMVGVFILTQVCTPDNQFENALLAFSTLEGGIQGYTPGNYVTLKCWDASEQLEISEFDISFDDPYGDAYVGDVFPDGNGQYSIVHIDFATTISQSYSLSGGYQFVSTRVIPDNQDMQTICTEILDNLDFVRNNEGYMLRKIGPVWINSIGDWITTEGYLFKMNFDDEFTISGSVIDTQTPIDLLFGYQMISYLPKFPINTSEVFADVLSNLDFVRNTDGQMFRKIGPNWINSIGDMQPGEGYLVKMYASDVLIYPVSDEKFTSVENHGSTHFNFKGGNPADPVWTIYFEKSSLEKGDEIAVYDEEKLAGAGLVVSDNILENTIPVFSNLYKDGHKPIVKVWDKSVNKEYILSDYTFSNPYGDAWIENIFPANDGEYSLLHFSATGISDENMISNISIYPNPSEGIFNISIEGVSGKIQIKVFDVHGNDYRKFEIEGTKSYTIKKLDLKELSPGVYFINFSGNEISRVKKIVIQ
jgi:hypothetical protein